ncbi:nuclease [Lottiidibacillus patelloidae]|uniref:Nuclease n=1 Tax=Lottiidibacillus patelloidae TaxID=2670334 RepID=A0A263BSY1_9BACI|nr:thermonuclease family protein [Lottiidibacillus patelloidae]OZM56286.1 nuclease [Lottiidibacillus patelloidae]
MKKLILLFFSILITLLMGCTSDGDYLYEVTKVVDGDTIKVIINNKEETIRLLLIDTPETVHPSKPVQPFGPEASTFVKELLEGKKVRIELGISERDKYGRLLAYVYTESGEMVNELLLAEGLARVAYIYEPNTKYVDQFYAIQNEARKQNVGIWSIENYDDLDDVEESTIDCNIKGNINSKGDKIYHLPSGAYYKQTIAEEMFCSEDKAEKAGFRKSKR